MSNAMSLLHQIGQTPLIALSRIGRGLPVPVLVKCEHLNPGGSPEVIERGSAMTIRWSRRGGSAANIR